MSGSTSLFTSETLLNRPLWHYSRGRRRLLHIGSGRQPLEGWINIDIQRLPGVDLILDVRDGLPIENAEAIFAEHFLEHLTLEDALTFLRESRRSLLPNGTLRISTPSLDWVYLTHYRLDSQIDNREAVRCCLDLNRAFHGYGHQFLFNGRTLTAGLRSAGFDRVVFRRYGESEVPVLHNLERHEKSGDTAELPHVLIIEATGRAEPVSLPEDLLTPYRSALLAR